MELKIDREFAELIPPLTKEELADLEKSILVEGSCHDPLILWEDVVIDGHNRLKIPKNRIDQGKLKEGIEEYSPL